MSGSRVVVVGGGLAGTSAALTCADAGAEVTLLEVRPRLGGAAYSFQRDGLWLDNGQHVFLRCCTAYRALLERVGGEEATVLQPRLDIPVLAPGGERGRLRRTALPAPLHLATALARYPFLSPRERVRVVRVARALGGVDYGDEALDRRSFGDWLVEQGESSAAVESLWDLVARPTLNLPVAEASLAAAAHVFQTALLSERDAGDLGYARVPLSAVHGDPAERALRAAGADVRLGWRAERIVAHGPGALEVEGPEGQRVEADAVVLAVPHQRAAALLPPGALSEPARLERLGSSPIVNLHLIYDRAVTELPFAAGVRTPVQWFFDRTGPSGLDRGQYLALSLSAAEAEMRLRPDELRSRFEPALAELLPRTRQARLESFFVTREHDATFRAAPGQRRLRPGLRTGVRDLFLAGAYTDTGWPATMEGAVRSGLAAAHEALAALDRSPAGLLALAPLWPEARAVASGAPGARVVRTGMGPRRARLAAARARAMPADAIAVTGFCGALDPELQPGDLLLATEVRGPDGAVPMPGAGLLAGMLRRRGIELRTGPLLSSERLVRGRERERLHATGALAVDMESGWLATAGDGRPLAVLRAVVDTPSRELRNPLATAGGALRAGRALARASAVLTEWAAAVRPRRILLAAPRAACAGVDRAIQVVDMALAQHGPPVYVRRQIVHNSHVIADLERRGAVFVHEIDEVPDDATVVFSAHGVPPAVRTQARERRLRAIDATCPLVSKVHAEARRFADAGYTIALVGHDGHDEVEGTTGEAPDRIRLVENVGDAEALEVEDPERLAYLTQTTWAVDDRNEVVDVLRKRFPRLVDPASDDICYATQNRQEAVKGIAADSDLLLVIGSRNSSNSNRLVEVAERHGCPARLVEDETEIDPAWLSGASTLGLTAGASAPEALVRQVLDALAALGPIEVEERTVTTEDLQFKLPPEVRARD